MPAISYSPYAMTDAVLMLGTDTFEDAINKAEFVPSYTNPTYDTINGSSHAVGDTATWVLNLDFGQDWIASTSLANYLAANDGEAITAELTPISGSGKKMTATVIIRAGAFGGTAKSVSTGTVTLPVSGVPVLAAAS